MQCRSLANAYMNRKIPVKAVCFIVSLLVLVCFYLIDLRPGLPKAKFFYQQANDKNSISDVGRVDSHHGEGQRQNCQAKDKYSKLKYFVLFIGYPRSGSTLVGSLLDAHPHVIIANEYDVVKKFPSIEKKNSPREHVFDELLRKSYLDANFVFRSLLSKSFYNYHIPNQWQGKYHCYIQVIGDKKGAGNIRGIQQSKNMLQRIQNVVKLPIKFIHVYRNPYDNIATMVLRQSRLRIKSLDKNFHVYKNQSLLRKKIDKYMSLVKQVEEIRQKYPKDVFDVDYKKLLQSPKTVLKDLCKFLGLECSNSYLSSCGKIVFRNQTYTRRKIQWTKQVKKSIAETLRALAPFRTEFTFQN